MTTEEIKNKVLAEYQKGNIVFNTLDSIRSMKLEDFIQQPLEGMLYDINRDTVTILSFLDDPKWINDYALTRLLTYYHDRCKELEEKLRNE